MERICEVFIPQLYQNCLPTKLTCPCAVGAAMEDNMPNSLFISYSRQEAPFVDSLLDELEDRGFKVWLDYHSLVPARPWREQIFRGVAEAGTTLVVVSKASMASNNVAPEWRRAVELKKRIILIIFEAAKLPPELAHYEWIDFRGSFKKGLAELLSQLETPVKEEHAPPQKGFKAPPVVWRAFWLSLLVGLHPDSFTLPDIKAEFQLLPRPVRGGDAALYLVFISILLCNL